MADRGDDFDFSDFDFGAGDGDAPSSDPTPDPNPVPDDEPPVEVYGGLQDEGESELGAATDADELPQADVDLFDHEAELAVLGAMLLAPTETRDVAIELSVSDFHDAKHAAVYGVQCDIVDRTGALDIVMLRIELEKRGLLDKLGGTQFLSAICEATPLTANAGHYASIVMEKAARRRLIHIGDTIATTARLEVFSVTDAMAMAERDLDVLGRSAAVVSGSGQTYDFAADMDDLIERLFDPDDRPKVLTGIDYLDEVVGGLPLGYPTIVGARPGVGKTGFAVDLIDEFCTRGELVYVLQVELDKTALQRRLIASAGGVDHGLLIGAKGIMDPDHPEARPHVERALSTAAQMRQWPLAIEAPPSGSISRVLPDVRRAERAYGKPVKLVVIDHAHALEPMPGMPKNATRVDMLTEISAATRKLAKQLPGAAVVLLWQLNRDTAKQRRAPMMSDLKGSGAAEQDADTIILLHRQTDDQPGDPEAPDAQIVIAKNRNGPVGVLEARWCPHAMTWRRDAWQVPSLRLAGANDYEESAR